MRTYLDHNATTPLRAEARAAMVAAMDVVGNPSSVHAEGRAAKGLVERARAQVAALVGCKVNQVVFTGSATEAAALGAAQQRDFIAFPTEHDCISANCSELAISIYGRDGPGQIEPLEISNLGLCAPIPSSGWEWGDYGLFAISCANSETGIMAFSDKSVPGNADALAADGQSVPISVLSDITQAAGKVSLKYRDQKPSYMILSAHKIGGPKGVGALINFTSEDPAPLFRGGGQEMGRRAGTENVIGIAGFGAAAEAAGRDVAAGRWEEVQENRDLMESALEAASNTTILVGKECARLPNTSCILTPGWRGETQVMQMDLAGFAISAGSACSSGKVKASSVLRAMGFDDNEAASAIRVSLGLDTTRDDVLRFAESWIAKLKKHEARAA